MAGVWGRVTIGQRHRQTESQKDSERQTDCGACVHFLVLFASCVWHERGGEAGHGGCVWVGRESVRGSVARQTAVANAAASAAAAIMHSHIHICTCVCLSVCLSVHAHPHKSTCISHPLSQPA